MPHKTAQLTLTFAPATLPKGHYLRTMTDKKMGFFCDFDPDICYEQQMTWHTLYKPDGMWLGHIFRDFADEPWQIAATGQGKVRGAWMEFNEAIANLLKWRKELDLEVEEWWRINASLSQSVTAEKMEKNLGKN